MKILVPLFLLWIILWWTGPSPASVVPEPAPAKCAGAAFLLDGEFPPPQTGDRGFDVLSYDLDFLLNSVSSRITGTVTIGLMALDPDLDTIHLDLVDELACTGITRNGEDQAFTHENDALLIHLPGPISTISPTTFQVSWDGRPPRHGEMYVGLLFRVHNNGTPDDPDDDVPVIANISEPWSAHSWWPCKDHPSDKALVSMAVTVPDTLRVVSNGRLRGVDQMEPGWYRHRWQESYPLPTYLVSVAVSDYHSWAEDCLTPAGPVPLEFYYFPPDREKAEHDFAPTCEMMEFMVDLAGPYPFAGEKYAQVEIKWTGAMEHTTASSISQILLTGDGRYENLILHELAHQWFGDSLTPGVWSDIWLNEGFARYCEALWVEHAYGVEAYREFMDSIGVSRHPTFFEGEGLLIDPDPILPNILVYNKGAWLLHSLRMLMGEGPFFDFLKSYANNSRLAQGTVFLADMITEAESHFGGDLSGFFDPWLETDAVPQIWYESLTGSRETAIARVTFHQLQEPLFQMAIPVRLETDCGSEDRLAVITRRDQVFEWDLPFPVRSVTVDPDSMVFMFQGKAPPPPLQVLGPAPNPIGRAGASFELFLTESSQVTAKMYDARGRKINEFDLGHIEATGPADDEASIPVVWEFQPDGLTLRPAAGTYWLDFQAGTGRVVKKMTLLH